MVGGTVLALVTVLTFSTIENEKNRGQMSLLGEHAISFEVLTQYFAQATRIYECNCNTNCLACTNSTAGCPPQFPLPTSGLVPNPTSLNLCAGGQGNSELDPYRQVATRIGIPVTALENRCLIHVEFEDLPAYPKHPPGRTFTSADIPTPLVGRWQAAPSEANLLNAATVSAGICNDYGRTGAAYYAAGCWKDLYVYYVAPKKEEPPVDSTPGYLVFAVTTSPSRNGGVDFVAGGGGRPLQVFTVGSLPTQTSSAGISTGVVGLACGYLPAFRGSFSSMPGGTGFASSPTGIPLSGALVSGYANNDPAFPRSLEFEFYALTKTRRNTSTYAADPTHYESWASDGNGFFNGQFRHFISRTLLHNLSERGIHFLRLFSTRVAASVEARGNVKDSGCYDNGKIPVPLSRGLCCSNSILSSGMCGACIPSGGAASGDQSCCSEQVPGGGVCP